MKELNKYLSDGDTDAALHGALENASRGKALGLGPAGALAGPGAHGPQ